MRENEPLVKTLSVAVCDDKGDLPRLLARLVVAEVGQGDRDVGLDLGSPGCERDIVSESAAREHERLEDRLTSLDGCRGDKDTKDESA